MQKFEKLPEVALHLGEVFSKQGYEIALVGGSVRDFFLKKSETESFAKLEPDGFPANNNDKKASDYDFTTSAKPDEILAVVKPLAKDLWTVGKKFGTIGGTIFNEKNEIVKFEITTYRADKYFDNSRKPQVKFGKTLLDDLCRRDFTINSMAVKLPDLELIDEFGGINDLAAKKLKTPIEPEKSFSDDPLRIMRLFRFMAQLDFLPDAKTLEAASNMADRLNIVSRERISEEFAKLIMTNDPVLALDCMTKTGVMDLIIPELPKLKLEIDERGQHKDNYWHSLKVLQNGIVLAQKGDFSDNLTIRLALLLHDIGKPATRKFDNFGKVSFYGHDIVGSRLAYKRLMNLRFPKTVCQDVAKLIKLHMRFYGYADSQWSDSAARRYAHDAGDLLDLLHILARSDCTT
ncbi:MAG: CCA tRNA nucleotidyltransferase, partial [Bifidobacteriaceae bacterium]|nr:CCA tRNA nucleotidyltransferase [Bifidobacteriaceae bacterium]